MWLNPKQTEPGPGSVDQLREDGEGQTVLQGQGHRLGRVADLAHPGRIDILVRDVTDERGHHLGVMEGLEGHGQAVVVLEHTEDGVLVSGQELRLPPGLPEPQGEVDGPLPHPGHDVDDAGTAPGDDLGLEDPDRGVPTVGVGIADEVGGDEIGQGFPGLVGQTSHPGPRRRHRGPPPERSPWSFGSWSISSNQ